MTTSHLSNVGEGEICLCHFISNVVSLLQEEEDMFGDESFNVTTFAPKLSSTCVSSAAGQVSAPAVRTTCSGVRHVMSDDDDDDDVEIVSETVKSRKCKKEVTAPPPVTSIPPTPSQDNYTTIPPVMEPPSPSCASLQSLPLPILAPETMSDTITFADLPNESPPSLNVSWLPRNESSVCPITPARAEVPLRPKRERKEDPMPPPTAGEFQMPSTGVKRRKLRGVREL